MYLFIEVLRLTAVCLITNSHLDGVYPIDISFGGSLGVALFFLISGYLLNSNKLYEQTFKSWWIPKVVRVCIPLYIVHLINAALGFRLLSIGLLFPVTNNCWYVPAIIILYLFFYVTYRCFKNKIKTCMIICCALYFLVYITKLPATDFFVEPTYYFRYFYGYFALLLGAEMRTKEQSKYKAKLCLVLSAIMVGLFLSLKILINKSYYLMQLQFLTQLMSVGFAYYITKGMLSLQDEIEGMKVRIPAIANIIQFLGKRTLEIYLVQFAIISLFKELIFPINLLLIIGVTIFVACGVNYVSSKITNGILVFLKRRGVI